MAAAWPPSADARTLYDQHLITEPARGRYRFHDPIREHARALAADDQPVRDAAASARPRYAMSIPARWPASAEPGATGIRAAAALAAARQVGDRPGQAYALLLLSPMQSMTEDSPAIAQPSSPAGRACCITAAGAS